MPTVTYDTIAPMIRTRDEQGSQIHVVFACPQTGDTVEATAVLRKEHTLANRATDSVKRSAMWSVRSSISRALRSVLGYGFLGRVGSDVIYSAMSGMGGSSSESFSEKEKRAAIVDAFEAVSSRFVWNPKQKQWVSARGAQEWLTDFAKQLQAAPVSGTYDRGVLARMLVEVAAADGRFAEEEKEFLGEFVGSEFGSLSELAKRPRLSEAELAETGRGAGRETMLMLAWGLAVTDEDLATAEKERLEQLREGLGISSERAQELFDAARLYVVDAAIENAYPDGVRDDAAHADAMALAQKLGVASDQAERVDIRFRKRAGIV